MITSRNTPFWLMETPFNDWGEAQNLLGVAFYNPGAGIHDSYAPGHQVRAKSNLDTLAAQVGGSGEKTERSTKDRKEETVPALTESIIGTAEQDLPKIWWPKQLMPKLSPDHPVDVRDAEFVLKKAEGMQGHAKLLDIVQAKLGSSKADENKTTIPIFKRYSMLDPYQNITTLWTKHESYKAELKHLFTTRKSKKLWIATHVIVCGSVSREELHSREVEANAQATDPTKTFPVSVGGEMRYLKESSIKGTYKDDIVLAMAYRCVEWNGKDDTNLAWPRIWIRGVEKLVSRQSTRSEDDDFVVHAKSARGIHPQFMDGDNLTAEPEGDEQEQAVHDTSEISWDEIEWKVFFNDDSDEEEEDAVAAAYPNLSNA